MPFISVKSTTGISREKEEKLCSEFGKAVKILGKSENWLMLDFEENCRLYFQGSDGKPSAFVEVKLFGTASSGVYSQMTEKVTQIISEELGVPCDRIYVKYEECAYWGWNGNNF